jgi:hypothetical protein
MREIVGCQLERFPSSPLSRIVASRTGLLYSHIPFLMNLPKTLNSLSVFQQVRESATSRLITGWIGLGNNCMGAAEAFSRSETEVGLVTMVTIESSFRISAPLYSTTLLWYIALSMSSYKVQKAGTGWCHILENNLLWLQFVNRQ